MCRARKLNDAKKLWSRIFENGLLPHAYTYSTMMKGFCSEGLLDEACKVFTGMKEGGYLPNGCWYFITISQAGDYTKSIATYW